MSLFDKLKDRPHPAPLWEGPAGPNRNGGATQGLLGRYLVCRERCRVHAMEGLAPADQFNPRLEYGNLWHVCEEALATRDPQDSRSWSDGQSRSWGSAVRDYVRDLCRKYPMQQGQVEHWYKLCKAQFPLYIEHWAKHPDVTARTPLLQEQVFDVPYTLPGGRKVRLRGKWDAVDLIGTGKGAGIYLQENKTKSSIDGQKIARQLTFDLQTMLYLVALGVYQKNLGIKDGEHFPIKTPAVGVRYNVVRRSAHKSAEAMVKKITEDREAGRIDEWFARWQVTVTAADLTRFRRQCLDPVLENLFDDYEWWHWCWRENQPGGSRDWDVFDYRRRGLEFPDHRRRHYRFPYGVYDPLTDGGSGDVDAYLDTGSTAGLTRRDVLFPELDTKETDNAVRDETDCSRPDRAARGRGTST